MILHCPGLFSSSLVTTSRYVSKQFYFCLTDHFSPRVFVPWHSTLNFILEQGNLPPYLQDSELTLISNAVLNDWLLSDVLAYLPQWHIFVIYSPTSVAGILTERGRDHDAAPGDAVLSTPPGYL